MCLNQSLDSPLAMALASPSVDVKEEVKCPICMEYLTDPVTLDCGHNFCRGCVTCYCKTWEGLGDLECPLCKAKMKKGNFRSNWQLANVVEKIKCLSYSLRKEYLCVTHKEKLNLFCKEDQELVCVICERSPEHRSHTVLLLEEAAEEYKDKLQSCLKNLKEEREIVLASKEGTEKESRDLLGQIEQKKTRTVAVFNQLHQFLEEQKSVLLSQLEELENEIETRIEEPMARLVEELGSLEGLIQQMEEKCRQPASELLQDIRRTLQRYEQKETFENHVAFPPELTCTIQGFRDINPLLEGVMELLNQVLYQAKVTLDPDTAHPKLILSEDRKSVRWISKRQALPNNPERFDSSPFVLGREGFTGGKHFWEVTVESEGTWAVGVARKSVWRKDSFYFNAEEGIWAVGKGIPQYRAYNSIDFTPLPLSLVLRRMRVTLNYAEGQVVFSDADSGVHLITLSEASFCGETILPFFYVAGEVHLTLSP